MRQTLKVGITMVVITALAMSGIALAQTSTDTTTTTVAVGDRPGYARLLDKLAPLVEAGTLSPDQAAAVADLLTMRGPRPLGPRFQAINEIAGLFGMTPRELGAALAEYDSLGAFAAANGSSAEEVIGLLIDAASAHLDEAVANGRITQDQKAERLAEATERITDLVNGELPDRPFHRPGGPGWQRGPDGSGPGPNAPGV